MKKQGKILAIVAAIVACLAMAVGLSACGGGKADVKDVYTAKGALLENTDEYKTKINTSYSLVLYTDGTYQLITLTNGYMGAYGNSQVMQMTVINSGNYVFTAGEFDDVATIKLEKATQIISNMMVNGSTVYVDTADASTLPEGKTAVEYLNENAKEFNLTVNPQDKTITSGLN